MAHDLYTPEQVREFWASRAAGLGYYNPGLSEKTKRQQMKIRKVKERKEQTGAKKLLDKLVETKE